MLYSNVTVFNVNPFSKWQRRACLCSYVFECLQKGWILEV